MGSRQRREAVYAPVCKAQVIGFGEATVTWGSWAFVAMYVFAFAREIVWLFWFDSENIEK